MYIICTCHKNNILSTVSQPFKNVKTILRLGQSKPGNCSWPWKSFLVWSMWIISDGSCHTHRKVWRFENTTDECVLDCNILFQIQRGIPGLWGKNWTSCHIVWKILIRLVIAEEPIHILGNLAFWSEKTHPSALLRHVSQPGPSWHLGPGNSLLWCCPGHWRVCLAASLAFIH